MTLQEAIVALHVHARQMEAWRTVAAAIGKVEDIDRLTQEAEQRRVDREKLVTEAEQRLTRVVSSIAAGEAKLPDIEARGELLLSNAKDRAEAIKQAAQAEAASLVKQAQADALAAAKSAREGAERLQAQVDDLSKQLVATDAELQSKGLLLDEIEGKLAKARKMFEGFVKA